MTADDQRQYDLEPQPDNPPDSSDRLGDAADVHSLDVCPNCGAPMRESDSLLCLRCGYDLKTLAVRKTEIAPQLDESDDAETDGVEQPIIAPGLGGFVLPEIIAALAGVILAAGYFAGSRGLFAGSDEIPVLLRMTEMLRCVLRIAVLTTCSLGALLALSHLLKRPLGDVRLGAVRLLGIVVAIQLLLFIHLPKHPGWEWTIELILQLAAFLGLAMLMLRVTVRQAAMVVGITSLAIVALLLVTNSVTWSILPPRAS